MRMGLDAYLMAVAHTAKERSTCPRAHVGAVVTRQGVVVGTGYNGSPRGTPHCEEFECMVDADGHCRVAVHAELNALLHCSGLADTIYCTHNPCLRCLQAIINFGITRVVYDEQYEDTAREAFLYVARRDLTWLVIEKLRRDA